MSQQFNDFIRRQLSMGATPEDIKKALATGTWSESDIEEALKSISGAQDPIVQTAAISVLVQEAATPVVVAKDHTQVSVADTQPPMEMPSSIRTFEVLMYTSLLVGILTTYFRYGLLGGSMPSFSTIYPLLILLQLPTLVIAVVAVWLAARSRKNWARWVLLVLFGLSSISGTASLLSLSSLSLSSLSVLISLAQPILQLVALCYVFSASANKWFGTSSETVTIASTVPASPSPGKWVGFSAALNRTWTRSIPATNIGFLLVYLGLLLGVDRPIVLANPELVGFWDAMLAVFAAFLLFFALETFIFRKKFSTTSSGADSSILIVIVLRNLLFLLNFIPFVQVIGLLGLPTVGLILLIVYCVYIARRFAGVKALQIKT